MRSRALIAVVLAALVAAAPAATAATKSGEETEVVFLELRPRKDTFVEVEIHPLLGVAVVKTWMGFSPRGEQRSRSGAVEYAAHIPKGPAAGQLNLKVPGIASIVGELVTTSPEISSSDEYCRGEEQSRQIEFRGTFDFHGNGGYLSFDAHRAEGFVQRTASPDCEMGRPEISRPHPSLFAYFPRESVFSNQNSQILYSQVSLPGRYTSFYARRFRDYPNSSFLAETVESLPRHVAARRRVEVEKASGGDFVASSKAKYPESAKVRPPRPFSGRAVFQRGDADAEGRGLLTGPMYADIYGVKVRVDAHEGYAALFNLNPGF